ncbi:MAG: FHA domain-containing protein [Muribaculaceae bacterium]|nr:FHA domain-containing protein [Muribaculaceae bacterium]
MPSDSTKVPGMGNNADSHDFYSRMRTGMPGSPAGTVVPGMNVYAPNVEEKAAQPAKSQVPVVGFLYSISRQGFGEYWPLHVGANKIGRTSASEICLAENTVSTNHAYINIKQLKTTGKLLAAIRDDQSKNGIFVNDEELDYDAHNLKNHDVITIGNNYKLLFILIDAEEMGLSVAENFEPVEEEDITAEDIRPAMTGMDDTSTLYNSANRVQGGTVAMDGSMPEPSGRTRFL